MVRKRIVHLVAHESFYNLINNFRRDFERKNNVRISTINATEIMARNWAIPKVNFKLGGKIERQKRRRN